MTGDDQYCDAAQKAVDYCVKIQSPEGGWRYEPGIDSDMSVTGWFVMALQSARMAGLEVPSPVFEPSQRVSRRASPATAAAATPTARRDGATLHAHRRRPAVPPVSGLAARRSAAATRASTTCSPTCPTWDKRNVYYWYYATQVLHHMEGTPWRAWNEEMRKLLPEKQVTRGRERGSWDPDGDRWGDDGGRLYVTCLSLYMLEVYYRHLPLYQTGRGKRQLLSSSGFQPDQ